jgi:hexosaminidase
MNLKDKFFTLKKHLNFIFRRFFVYYKKEKLDSKIKHNILPEPFFIEIKEGEYLSLKDKIKVYCKHQESFSLIFENCIDFIFTEREEADFIFTEKNSLISGGYEIEIVEKVFVSYGEKLGFLYSLYTLKKLLEEDAGKISKLKIIDKPKHDWRGFHLDVARHYMPISFLEDLIKSFSGLKLNKFHLHLSDDQGYRIESFVYPKLSSIASKRKETVEGKYFFPFLKGYKADGKEYSFFYTQEELKKLVIFGEMYGVEIIPEIDIPGHATAILSAYKEYSAANPPRGVSTRWGIFKNVMSTSDESIVFLKNLFDELCEIFPSKYIHIGGDEVPLYNYKKSRDVKTKVESGVLSSYKEAPKYILNQIALHLKNKGRVAIMWDDAIDTAKEVGGIVMVWQSFDHLKIIAREKVKYICVSSSHFYFDYYQKKNIKKEPLAIGGYISTPDVYKVEIPDSDYLLGVQGALWTEYIKTKEEAAYMIYPRIYALAEVSWGKYNESLSIFLKKIK